MFVTATHLSGGPDDEDADEAGTSVHRIVTGIAAFVLHRLGAVLPDLTFEERDRLERAAIDLDLLVCGA